MTQVKFSTLNVPDNKHVNVFQGIYTSNAHIDIEACQRHTPSWETVECLLPNLGVYETIISPHLSRRTGLHLAVETNENLALVVPIDNSAFFISENKEPIHYLSGEALLMPSNLIYQAFNPNAILMTMIVIPRKFVETRISNLNQRLVQKFSKTSSPELNLLIGYARMLIKMKTKLSSELVSLASTQIHDLFVLLCSAKKEETEISSKLGLRAARLNLIKQDIMTHITDSDLSINQVAQRQAISPQYIRALFHSKATTFADYVIGLRLAHAYRLLCNPLYKEKISVK